MRIALAACALALIKDEWTLKEASSVTSFSKTPGSYCSGKNILTDAVAEHSCVTKCGPGSYCEQYPTATQCAACSGYNEAYDADSPDALCLAEEDCKALCTSLDTCYAIDVSVDQSNFKRCYLNTASCLVDVHTSTLKTDKNYKFLKKEVEINDECPMGHGARISGMPDPYGVTGLYDRITEGAEIIYARVDGSDRIAWHASGCGWVVKKPEARRLAAHEATACVDDAPAASAAFGVATEDAICATAVWAANAGYCEHVLFAALCPGTCRVPADLCKADNDPAGSELAILAGSSAPRGSCADVLKFCADPVVASVCKATCAKPRNRARLPSSFAREFRLALKETGRRLGREASKEWYEVYYTFRPTIAPAALLDCGGTASYAALDSVTTLYDVFALTMPSTQAWSHSCARLDVYGTRPHAYCPHNQLPTSDNSTCLVNC
jgi:hypothetical protein